MGDVSLNRPIKVEPAAGSYGQEDRILDKMSAGWTDERHMRYISSMEASFVNQLRNHGHHSHNSNGNGFKVLRGGLWEYIKYEKTNACAQSRTKYRLPANPWIQRFRPRDCGSNAQSGGLDQASDCDQESGTETNQKTISLSHETKWEDCNGENQFPVETTEVSDQNFADDEAEPDVQSIRACKRRRSSVTSKLELV